MCLYSLISLTSSRRERAKQGGQSDLRAESLRQRRTKRERSRPVLASSEPTKSHGWPGKWFSIFFSLLLPLFAISMAFWNYFWLCECRILYVFYVLFFSQSNNSSHGPFCSKAAPTSTVRSRALSIFSFRFVRIRVVSYESNRKNLVSVEPLEFRNSFPVSIRYLPKPKCFGCFARNETKFRSLPVSFSPNGPS